MEASIISEQAMAPELVTVAVMAAGEAPATQ